MFSCENWHVNIDGHELDDDAVYQYHYEDNATKKQPQNVNQ